MVKTARPFFSRTGMGKVRAGFSWSLASGLLLLLFGPVPGLLTLRAQAPPLSSPVPLQEQVQASAPSSQGNVPASTVPAPPSFPAVWNADEGQWEALVPVVLLPRFEGLAAACALYAQGYQIEAESGLGAAIPLYRAALKQDPSCFSLYLKIALSLLTERRIADADSLLSDGLAANPDSASLLAALALTREYEGQWADALRFAARAKEIAPEHLLAHRVAFETLRNQRKDTDALQMIRAAAALPVEKIPKAQDWAALARLYTELAISMGPLPVPASASATSSKPAPARNPLADLILPFYTKALSLGPPTRDLLRQRGEFSLYLGKKDEAYGFLKQASSLDDANVEIYVTLASLCLDLGKNGEALDNYEKAYALQPDFPELWKVLAHLYLSPDTPNIRQPDKAIALLEGVLRRNPTELDAADALGDLYYETKRMDKAEFALHEALAISLSSPKTAAPAFHLKLALFLLRQNRPEEAAALLAEAEKRFPQSARIPFVEGIVARNRKQSKEALDFFAKARLMAKDQESDLLNGEFYCELSIAQEQAGQIAQSEETLKQGLVLEPQSPNLLNALAYLWAEQNKNLDDALKYSRRSLELKPGQGEYIDTLGWIEFRLGRYQDAVETLQKAADLTGNDETVLGHLADALVKLGKPDDAQKILQKIAKKDPDNADTKKKPGN